MRLTLSEQDRKRFGIVEDWLYIDLETVSVREAMFLQQVGYDSPRDWLQALNGRQLVKDGAFVYEVDADGNRLLDADQLPIVKRGPREYQAWAVLVWLALARHGVKTDWDTFDYDLTGFDYGVDPEPEGKDETTESSTTTTWANSCGSTPPT